MQALNRFLLVGLVALTPVPAAMASASPAAAVPPAQTVGSIKYLSGGSDPAQAVAMEHTAARYPLELDFLWGRGAKESDIAGVEWSIRNAGGHDLLDASSGGPIVLASLPDGRYTVTAHYDGDTQSRVVNVRKGAHDTVLLEWPQ